MLEYSHKPREAMGLGQHHTEGNWQSPHLKSGLIVLKAWAWAAMPGGLPEGWPVC